MSNQIGNRFRVLIYGQSHAPSIGAVIEGLPAGFRPDWESVYAFMARRAPGNSPASTARKEADTLYLVRSHYFFTLRRRVLDRLDSDVTVIY